MVRSTTRIRTLRRSPVEEAHELSELAPAPRALLLREDRPSALHRRERARVLGLRDRGDVIVTTLILHAAALTERTTACYRERTTSSMNVSALTSTLRVAGRDRTPPVDAAANGLSRASVKIPPMKEDGLQHQGGRGYWPLVGTVRRTPVSAASFGALDFSCGLVLRRTDDTVVVQVDASGRSADIVEMFRAVGVAQLAFDRTICRARAVGWDAALGAVIFELHRPVFPEVGATLPDVARAA